MGICIDDIRDIIKEHHEGLGKVKLVGTKEINFQKNQNLVDLILKLAFSKFMLIILNGIPADPNCE